MITYKAFVLSLSRVNLFMETYEIEMGNCLLVISRDIIRYIVLEMIYQIYQLHTNLSYNIMEYISKCWIKNICCVC